MALLKTKHWRTAFVRAIIDAPGTRAGRAHERRNVTVQASCCKDSRALSLSRLRNRVQEALSGSAGKAHARMDSLTKPRPERLVFSTTTSCRLNSHRRTDLCTSGVALGAVENPLMQSNRNPLGAAKSYPKGL